MVKTRSLFIKGADAILPWDKNAVDTTVKLQPGNSDLPTGVNDTAMAGHALAENCILITNNLCKFQRVQVLTVEDWVR